MVEDVFHDVVIRARQYDGWTITHEHLSIAYGKSDVFIDSGAEQRLAAELGGIAPANGIARLS